MKTDIETRTDVLAALRLDTSIHYEDIAVAVTDGVVTLVGTVDSYAQRYAAEHAVEGMKCTHGIVNDLRVKVPGPLSRPDAAIARAAVKTLRWHVEVPADRIRVTVANGWLTLEGRVARPDEKESAASALRHLIGLTGVTNLITLNELGTTPIATKLRPSPDRAQRLPSRKAIT